MIIKSIEHYNLGTINQNKIEIIAEKPRDPNTYRFTFYFSYQTLIGVTWNDGVSYRVYVSQNYWSVTTGKLLNKLEKDKMKRVDSETLKQALEAAFAFLNT